MTDAEKIRQTLDTYIHAVHTQQPTDILPILTEDAMLISITTVYRGAASIARDFLQGGIHKAYTSIDLVADSLDIRVLSDDAAVVLFSYHTECVLRQTGAPFGIEGLETQLYTKQNGVWKLAHVHYSK